MLPHSLLLASACGRGRAEKAGHLAPRRSQHASTRKVYSYNIITRLWSFINRGWLSNAASHLRELAVTLIDVLLSPHDFVSQSSNATLGYCLPTAAMT